MDLAPLSRVDARLDDVVGASGRPTVENESSSEEMTCGEAAALSTLVRTRPGGAVFLLMLGVWNAAACSGGIAGTGTAGIGGGGGVVVRVGSLKSSLLS